jgi:hypothetical protein
MTFGALIYGLACLVVGAAIGVLGLALCLAASKQSKDN